MIFEKIFDFQDTFPQLFVQLYIKLLNIDKCFNKFFFVYAVTAHLEVFISGFVYNSTSNFENSHTYSVGIAISKTFTQCKSSEKIEDIVRKCMDKESVSIYSHRLTADMTESKFIFTFLDEILHCTAFAVCIDNLLCFAFH